MQIMFYIIWQTDKYNKFYRIQSEMAVFFMLNFHQIILFIKKITIVYNLFGQYVLPSVHLPPHWKKN